MRVASAGTVVCLARISGDPAVFLPTSPGSKPSHRLVVLPARSEVLGVQPLFLRGITVQAGKYSRKGHPE